MKNILNLWLKPQDVCNEYGISKSTQAKWRMNKKIPFYKLGKFIKYNRDDLDSWITKHKVTTID